MECPCSGWMDRGYEGRTTILIRGQTAMPGPQVFREHTPHPLGLSFFVCEVETHARRRQAGGMSKHTGHGGP